MARKANAVTIVSEIGGLSFDCVIEDDDADAVAIAVADAADVDADADADVVVDVLAFGCFPFGAISAFGPRSTEEQKRRNEESKFKVKGTRWVDFQHS
jgi:hypothetical protein